MTLWKILVLTFGLIFLVLSPILIDIARETLVQKIAEKISWCRETPKIDFGTFKTWYEFNPEKWFICDNYVMKIECCSLRFSYFDTIRYKKWKKSINKINYKQLKVKKLQQVVKSVKEDIEEYERRRDLI